MATCRDIITKGLKMAKVIGLDDSLSASEADLGLDVLQSLYRSWFSSAEFGLLQEVYAAEDYTAKEQERITAETGVSVTLPTTFTDSAEAYGQGSGNTRAPFELSSIEVQQNGEALSYVWERGSWVDINGLTLNADAPLAHYGEGGLAACFAMYYADTFGAQIGAGQKMLSDNFKAAFRNRRVAASPRAEQVYY